MSWLLHFPLGQFIFAFDETSGRDFVRPVGEAEFDVASGEGGQKVSVTPGAGDLDAGGAGPELTAFGEVELEVGVVLDNPVDRLLIADFGLDRQERPAFPEEEVR